ncbi:thermonuclease family protein [Paenibacillus harenae]|uniref:thermonuclease family protein n=1 Tax=Paenibacillus harenae TaxID=306543 RepID=UPI002793F8F3|nr:thermonuclease family protein [Paenibacillus harenae]MDQ0059557.1 micrococcal nuclease [Paenibacillus harenae]
MKRIGIALLMLGCFSLASCSWATTSPQKLQTNVWYSVSDYIDGDTFQIKVGDGNRTVRLLYVNTPEIAHADLNRTEEPFGREAYDYTKQALSESEEIRLSFDKEQEDKYDRTLAVVELKDGRILNEALLEEGLAKVMIVEPNVKLENVYKQIEQTAKQAELGLWGTDREKFKNAYPVKEAEQIGIELIVDKQAEIATITNNSDMNIELGGWKLVSVRGNQTYEFEKYKLSAGDKVTISSNNGKDLLPDKHLRWGKESIWSNSETDPGELYNANNELVTVWEDK